MPKMDLSKNVLVPTDIGRLYFIDLAKELSRGQINKWYGWEYL